MANTSKPKINKAKKVISANLTGGKGFGFEDQVGAWFLVHMLAGVCPLDEKLGSLKQLDFQTEASGWQLDDLLLTYDADGTRYRCACSVKSNRQFTASKAPEDFVERCWTQFLATKNNPFSEKTDRLVNITSTLPQSTEDSLFSLLNAAYARLPSEMSNQLANGDLSDNSRSLFKSFSCPEKLVAEYSNRRVETSELLRCIMVFSLDLENPDSADKAKVLALCRQVVTTGELETANELWEALVLLVNKYRVERGSIRVVPEVLLIAV